MFQGKLHVLEIIITAQKLKFSIKDFFSECDQIRSFLRIWSHLLKKSLMENIIFCGVNESYLTQNLGFAVFCSEDLNKSCQ